MNAPREPAAGIDPRQPWPGLASFSEETRGFFYGREEEVAELSRRIQRKLLTVLFGQSGLGKTSILRAGIVPRLRAQGYCPVYVRVDYGPDAPAAAVQIKQAIMQATTAVGSWSRGGVAAADESLWEFLHHRDDVLTDAQGKPLIPLLIFDQFEEIFTLAQGDDDGRARAAAFIAALSELVENRPSAALEARLEDDDSAVERFDFARADYRVLLALREDYLAHLESLKGGIPSITQNRMRLAPMTGQQALAAVTGPGGALVTQEVAEAIVRFVAGGSELAHAQVEPSLLSLICRELNDKRIQAGREALTLDLLAGSHAGILSDFYERALADQPEAVRAVVEDLLLTDSGYRENVAEERVRAAFADAGGAPGALAALVDRRLLRVEERLDVRRVELAHDVLCGVVAASRVQRKEREAHAITTRNLAAQRERERATRKSLVRARQIAAGCVVLTVCAIGGAGFGYVNMKQAQQTRAQADSSRASAEQLVSYLVDDFFDELQPIGRIDMLSELTGRTVAYYRGLPAAMRNAGTNANLGMALGLLGEVRLAKGNPAEAVALLDESIAVLTPLAAGDKSEALHLALARALHQRSRLAFFNGERNVALKFSARAIALAAPYATAPGASVAARRWNAIVRTQLGYVEMRSGDYDGARKELGAARDIAGWDIGRGANLGLQVARLNAASWLQEAWTTGPGSNAALGESLAHEVLSGTAQLLERQPNHTGLLEIRERVLLMLGNNALSRHRPGVAIARFGEAIDLARGLLRSDPDNTRYADFEAINCGLRALAFLRQGHPAEAAKGAADVWRLYERREPSPYQTLNVGFVATVMAEHYAELGDTAALEAMLQRKHGYDEIRRRSQVGGVPAEVLAVFRAGDALRLAALAGLQQTRRADVAELIAHAGRLLDRSKLDPQTALELKDNVRDMHIIAARLATDAGDFKAAEEESRLALRMAATEDTDGEYINMDVLRDQRALALAHLKRYPEAQALAGQVLAEQRAHLRDSDDQFLRLEMAQSLYALALAKPGAGGAELREAAALLAALPATMQGYRSVKLWRARVQAAQSGAGGAAGDGAASHE